MLFSADETTDLGSDSATPVTDDDSSRGRPSSPAAFDWVEIDLGDDAADADHLITPEERPQGRDGEAVSCRPAPCRAERRRYRRGANGSSTSWPGCTIP